MFLIGSSTVTDQFSEFYIDKHDGRILKNSDKFTDCLLRLPLFYELETEQVNMITDLI